MPAYQPINSVIPQSQGDKKHDTAQAPSRWVFCVRAPRRRTRLILVSHAEALRGTVAFDTPRCFQRRRHIERERCFFETWMRKHAIQQQVSSSSAKTHLVYCTNTSKYTFI